LPRKEVMTLRIGHLPQRTAREFPRYLIWFLVAYAPIAAILTLWAGTPLRGILIFGGVVVPVVAALLAVLSVAVGGAGDPHPQDSRPYDYDPGSDPVFRSGGGYGASVGWHDYDGPDGGDVGGW